MNDIVLNGETLEISEVVDSIVISGFDHTFDQNKLEENLYIKGRDQTVLEELDVEDNGTYTPGPGVDGFNKVVVDVAGGGSGSIITVRTGFDVTAVSNNTITIQTGVL